MCTMWEELGCFSTIASGSWQSDLSVVRSGLAVLVGGTGSARLLGLTPALSGPPEVRVCVCT